MSDGKVGLKATIGNLIFKCKTYWRKPPTGYDVTYKEFVNLSLGYGGVSFLNTLIQWTTLATTTHMMISYFKVSTGLVWALGIVAAIIAIIRSPILSMLIDNSNSERGKFKPFLMWTVIASCICFGLIPFVPRDWNSISILTFNLPAMPIVNIAESTSITVSLAVLVMFLLIQVGSFFSTLLNQCMAGVEQTISTVAQERANIGAIRGLICNIPSSVVNIVLPILAGSLFAESGGWNSIAMYRTVFPFCAVGAVVCMLFTVKGTKERVVVNKKYVAKVRFIDGAKELCKTKYFWIINIFNIFITIRGLGNMANWITQYSFNTESAKTLVGLYCTTLLMNILIVGMVLGPFVIKKYGKKKVLCFSNIGFAVMVLFQFLVCSRPVLILIAMFCQNFFSGFHYVAGIMVSDVMDYMQFKTGKRLEGFWQNFSTIVTTFVGIFTGLLAPIFLSFAGLGFSDDISIALTDGAMRTSIFRYQTLLALIGSTAAIIPMLFYDLKESEHANIIRVLKLRAAVTNYHDNELTDADVLNVVEAINFTKDNHIAILDTELLKFADDVQAIVSLYDDARVRVDAINAASDAAEFERNLELERMRLDSNLLKAQERASKKGLPFDAEEYTRSFIARSRFISQVEKEDELTASSEINPDDTSTVDSINNTQ